MRQQFRQCTAITTNGSHATVLSESATTLGEPDQPVANLQAQVNNPPQPPPQQPAPMNKNWEFMSHRPPVFTHAADPLDADDWLETVGKKLTTA
jgi:hypothetical protein